MRILADEPRKKMVLESPRAWPRLPFEPARSLTFEHERLHLRHGEWGATFRFLDVEHFELLRDAAVPAGVQPVAVLSADHAEDA
ncbi:MAG TPA: hypothetical protein VK420_10350 [Longimicrobium sp.]|nr:hypothetical protein [Longimicrobium sp.]